MDYDYGEECGTCYYYYNMYQGQGNYQQGNYPPGNYPQGNYPQQCNRVLCGIMAIVLGYLGLHYFCMGKTSGGIICIVLTFISFGVWNIINFIQGIMMLTMTDAEFMAKYQNNYRTFPVF